MKSNPFGHIAIAVQCHGVYSFGTGTPLGGDLYAYRNSQTARRAVKLTIINTTPAQEERMLRYLRRQKDDLSMLAGDTCSSRVYRTLEAAGFEYPIFPQVESEFGPDPKLSAFSQLFAELAQARMGGISLRFIQGAHVTLESAPRLNIFNPGR